MARWWTPSRAVTEPIVRELARRPHLWWTALATTRRLAAPGWWRRAPFLPLPDSRIWEFRMITAYGRVDADPVVSDVVSYLEWCRSSGGMHPRGERKVRLSEGSCRGYRPPPARRG